MAVCAWTGPNAGSLASSLVSRVIAVLTAGEVASPSTTICTGLTPPAENCFSSTAKPCLLSKPFGNELTPETPVFMSSAGYASSSRTATPTMRAMAGRFIAR